MRLVGFISHYLLQTLPLQTYHWMWCELEAPSMENTTHQHCAPWFPVVHKRKWSNPALIPPQHPLLPLHLISTSLIGDGDHLSIVGCWLRHADDEGCCFVLAVAFWLVLTWMFVPLFIFLPPSNGNKWVDSNIEVIYAVIHGTINKGLKRICILVQLGGVF